MAKLTVEIVTAERQVYNETDVDMVVAPGSEGVPRIRASTDVGNAPMARAFARAGYVTFERQLDMTWS